MWFTSRKHWSLHRFPDIGLIKQSNTHTHTVPRLSPSGTLGSIEQSRKSNTQIKKRHTGEGQLVRKNPPPLGGFLFTMFLIKNREEEDPPGRTTPKMHQSWGWFFKGGSSSSRFLIREHTKYENRPGGRGSFDQNRGNLGLIKQSLGTHTPAYCRSGLPVTAEPAAAHDDV